MLQQLKILVKAQCAEIRYTRHEEQKILKYGRWLNGKFKKRHRKGEPKPEAPDPAELNKRYPNDRGIRMERAYDLYKNLHDMRKNELRVETRHTQLAYGFLRGKSYKELECSGCYEAPDFEAILLNALEFLPATEKEEDVRERFKKWEEDAEEWLENEGNLNPPFDGPTQKVEEKKENAA